MHRDYKSTLVMEVDIIADDDTIRFKIRNAGRGKVGNMVLKSEITIIPVM